MRQHLAIGAVLALLGGAGVLWQVDQAVTSPRAQVAPLLCPLGGHGAVPARTQDAFSAAAAWPR